MFGWRTMIAFPFVTVCSGDYLMVAFIGIISAGAFMSYITASRHFSFSLFGLWGLLNLCFWSSFPFCWEKYKGRRVAYVCACLGRSWIIDI